MADFIVRELRIEDAGQPQGSHCQNETLPYGTS